MFCLHLRAAYCRAISRTSLLLLLLINFLLLLLYIMCSMIVLIQPFGWHTLINDSRMSRSPRYTQTNYSVSLCPRPGALSDDARLTSVCLSLCLYVTNIGPKSRTERPRKTKIGTKVANVTRDWDTTFKVKRSKVNCRPGRVHIVAASRTACYY